MMDYLDDNLRRLKRDLSDINEECLHWQVDPTTNSIGVILWHMGRLLDVFFTRHASGLTPEEECWFRYGWAETTGYDPRGIGRDGWGTLNEYTRYQIISMALMDNVRHLGEIRLIKSLYERNKS